MRDIGGYPIQLTESLLAAARCCDRRHFLLRSDIKRALVVTQTPDIIVFGHSHSVCLLDALGDWQAKLPETEGSYWSDLDLTAQNLTFETNFPNSSQNYTVKAMPVSEKSEGRQLVEPQQKQGNETVYGIYAGLEKYVSQFAGAKYLVSAAFGHNLARRQYVNNWPPYDFFELGAEAVEGALLPGHRPIDRQYILKRMLPEVGKLSVFFRFIKSRHPEMKFWHLPPPPPIENPDDASSKEIFGGVFEKYGLVAPSVRLKWYRSFIFLLQRSLTPDGVSLVLPPEGTICEKGFLKKEFLTGLTHANGEYGRLCWENIVKDLET